MKQILKYLLYPTRALTECLIPHAAEIMCVRVQNECPVVYALVDIDEQRRRSPGLMEIRTFRVICTGDIVPYDDAKYVGTVQIGIEVLHVFEVTQR